jgi:hypothetical protein
MNAALEEFDRAIERGRGPLDAARKDRDIVGTWPKRVRWSQRRRRGFEGGEPVPVEPRPKPKPLMDGAEAPIE